MRCQPLRRALAVYPKTVKLISPKGIVLLDYVPDRDDNLAVPVYPACETTFIVAGLGIWR